MDLKTLTTLERAAWPIISQLPPSFVVAQYSARRLEFLAQLSDERAKQAYTAPAKLGRVLWGIEFGSPILNAAGLFKNGDCYELVASQGAGGFLAGTTTYHERRGNEKHDVHLPFVPYRGSHAASNWLGLPNESDGQVAIRLHGLRRRPKCPVGISVMGSPNFTADQQPEKLAALVDGMQRYDAAGVDFIEMDESCPNTEHGKPQDDALAQRLRYVKDNFLDNRCRRLPVIVKFSNDTADAQVPALIDMLVEYGFDGVNFGNTSTDYQKRRSHIAASERKLFDYFTSTFGGGVSGRPLKEDSLRLASLAVQEVRRKSPVQEFHVIRTGGIETADDIRASDRAGISLNQWYTGYFEQFAKHGGRAYQALYGELLK
jgi:dihydroorotate dehydrogenase